MEDYVIPNPKNSVHSITKHFHIKFGYDDNIKEYYLKDLKHRRSVINMIRNFNEHILVIFNWDMLLHLHELKISYKFLSKFVINENTIPFDVQCYIKSVKQHFRNQEWVLSLGHYKMCKYSGSDNVQHPKYSMKPKLFDDGTIKERQKYQFKEYIKSDKGKKAIQQANRNYYSKNKEKIALQYANKKYDKSTGFNLDEQLNKRPIRSILKQYRDE